MNRRNGGKSHIATVFLLLFLATGSSFGQNSLDRIMSRGELVIATDPTYPPFEVKDNGILQGFDIDLGEELARSLGVKVRWEPMEWAGVLGALETGKVDLVMSGMTITEERKKGNSFSRPYFLSGQTIARRRGDARITGLNSLLDKIVAVQQETTGQYAIQKRGVPKSRIRRYDQLQDALMDVRNGGADAVVADDVTLKMLIRKGYPELELVGGDFQKENLGIAARKDESELLFAVNIALDKLFADGRYGQIYKKWIGEPLTSEIIAGLYNNRNDGSYKIETTGAEAQTANGPNSGGKINPPEQAVGSAFTIRWPLLRHAMPQLLLGAKLTLQVTFLSLILGLPVGLLIALCRLAHFKALRIPATLYVELVRGTPLLMQIYVIYFVLPAFDINLPPFLSAVMALSLNSAAYMSEIFRSGIEGIDSGQMEAARSLGLDYRASMRWIILPQAIRRVLPPLTNEAVSLLKESSLVSVVALSELMRTGKEFATNAGSPTTIYLAVALLYLMMTLPLTWLVRRLETKWQPVSRIKTGKPRKAAA